VGKVFRIGTVRYNCPMSAHLSQAFGIAHCTDSEYLPVVDTVLSIPDQSRASIIGVSSRIFSHCACQLHVVTSELRPACILWAHACELFLYSR